jgi:hypothetical protein
VFRRVDAVETHDGEFLVFDVNAAEEMAAVVSLWDHVEDVAANFAQEFAAAIGELVVRLIEAPEVGESHEEESARFEGPKEIARFWMLNDGQQSDALGEIGLPEEVEIVRRGEPEGFIFPGALDVGFDDWFTPENFGLHFFFSWKDEFGELLWCKCGGRGVGTSG